MEILQQMIIFSLLILVGVIARRNGIIRQENIPQLTSLVLNYAMPAIILSGITTSTTHLAGHALITLFITVIFTIILLILGSMVISRMLNYEHEFRGVITAMTTFTNISMMGVPMIYSLFGADAMIYMTAFLLPYNILFFTYGYHCMRDKSQPQIKRGWNQAIKILNPGIVACILALLLYIFNVPVPYLLAQPIHLLGAMTGPLSMMLIGSFLVDMDWRDALQDPKIWCYTAIKMLILPILILLFMKQFLADRLLLGVLLAAVSTPAGAGVPLLAQVLNKKSYPLALKGAAMTTLAALVTMPIVAAITGIG